MNTQTAIGVDIGGSHITAALIALNDFSVAPDSLCRQAVDARGSASDIIASWAGVIKTVLTKKEDGFTGKIGIAMPGPFDYEQGISFIRNLDKYEALYGLPVKLLLAESLQMDAGKISFMNDAGCFLQGEAAGGAAKGYARAIGLTLGTGVGTARYAQGKAEDAALWQSAFKDSIAEEYFATRWFLKRYKAATRQNVEGVKTLATLCRKGDAEACAVFEEFAINFANFLQVFIEADKPEVVVIGGNVARASDLFFPKTSALLAEKGIHTPLKNAILGESAALIGAASFCK